MSDTNKIRLNISEIKIGGIRVINEDKAELLEIVIDQSDNDIRLSHQDCEDLLDALAMIGFKQRGLMVLDKGDEVKE